MELQFDPCRIRSDSTQIPYSLGRRESALKLRDRKRLVVIVIFEKSPGRYPWQTLEVIHQALGKERSTYGFESRQLS